MRILLLFTLLITGCVSQVNFPYSVVGKYQYIDGKCMLYVRHGDDSDLVVTTATVDNCQHNIGDVIK